jgi:predicted GTPase
MNITNKISAWFKRGESQRADQSDPPPEAGPAGATTDQLPVVWLLGKSGSGKSSIVAALTGASQVEIGRGYVPCTRTANAFDFPADEPLLRFLDTRGLGEKGYDPTADLAVNERQAHLLILTMRVRDDAQDAVLAIVREIRRRHPDWPLIVAQTGLHDLYDGTDNHPSGTYPFKGTSADDALTNVPRALRAALQNQRERLARLPGAAPLFVPIDLTRPEDGYTPADYGREALVEAILHTTPEAAASIAALQMRQHARQWSDIPPGVHRLILSFAGGASGVGMVPVVGIGTVVAAHAGMVWAMARKMDVSMARQDVASLLGMLGLATLARQGAMLGLRQVAKLAPFLTPVMALQDYAVTYALGRATYIYLRARQTNQAAEPEAVKAAFKQGLKDAFAFRSRREKAA